jgi:hypothetical protein
VPVAGVIQFPERLCLDGVRGDEPHHNAGIQLVLERRTHDLLYGLARDECLAATGRYLDADERHTAIARMVDTLGQLVEREPSIQVRLLQKLHIRDERCYCSLLVFLEFHRISRRLSRMGSV